jgi:hypothetical protein
MVHHHRWISQQELGLDGEDTPSFQKKNPSLRSLIHRFWLIVGFSLEKYFQKAISKIYYTEAPSLWSIYFPILFL